MSSGPYQKDPTGVKKNPVDHTSSNRNARYHHSHRQHFSVVL
jgi:hypothetical protein